MKPVRSSLVIVFVFATVCLTLSETPSHGAAHDLGGSSWQLVKFMGGDDSTLTPADKSHYTIAFESSGAVRVRISCNRGQGSWKSSGSSNLEFGPLALTRAMCPPAPLNDRLAKDWQYVRSYVLKNGHLFLSLMADGGIYEFEPMNSGHGEAAKAPALENTHWQLTRLGDSAIESGDHQATPRLTFHSQHHRIFGSSGCNRVMGSYEVKDNHLKIGQAAGTMMACPHGMETEKAFLEALQQVATWKIDGNRLDLIDAAGKTLASFAAVAEEHRASPSH